MSVQPIQPAKHYARMICKHMKELPDRYADDPQDVQTALGLTDLEFNLGLDLCIQRGVIQLEKKGAPSRADDDATSPASPFTMGAPHRADDEATSPASPFAMDAGETGEFAVVDAVKAW